MNTFDILRLELFGARYSLALMNRYHEHYTMLIEAARKRKDKQEEIVNQAVLETEINPMRYYARKRVEDLEREYRSVHAQMTRGKTQVISYGKNGTAQIVIKLNGKSYTRHVCFTNREQTVAVGKPITDDLDMVDYLFMGAA